MSHAKLQQAGIRVKGLGVGCGFGGILFGLWGIGPSSRLDSLARARNADSIHLPDSHSLKREAATHCRVLGASDFSGLPCGLGFDYAFIQTSEPHNPKPPST